MFWFHTSSRRRDLWKIRTKPDELAVVKKERDEALARLEEIKLLVDILLTPNVRRSHVNKMIRAWREEWPDT